jgi:2'-5' RNA ligase
MGIRNIRITKLYNDLWEDALGLFAQGQVDLDWYLVNRQSDNRLGLTVIARPTQRVVDNISALIDQLALVEPDQYYYQPDELHITILSLFTATEHFKPYFAKLANYMTASEAVLSTAKCFAVDFRGVTASTSGVMAQGFPQDGNLEVLRERLRKALREQDLEQGLDTRYRLRTAHATLMRFRQPPQALTKLVGILKEYRDYYFGGITFRTLQVVKNDWYMSTGRVEVLAEYQLS